MYLKILVDIEIFFQENNGYGNVLIEGINIMIYSNIIRWIMDPNLLRKSAERMQKYLE